jgi:hypothetical protein
MKMKQKIYTLGLADALLVFTGAIFKVNHFPGAGIMLTIGILGFVLVFLPAALINHYRSGENKQNLSLYIVTWITCLVIFVAMLFKIMHWPFAGIMLLIAIPFPYVIFLPVFLIVTSKNKNFNIYNTVFILLLLALNSVFSGLLALSPTRYRIQESYILSRDYNKTYSLLDKSNMYVLPSPVNNRIDEVIKKIDQAQDAVLYLEQIPPEKWTNDPGALTGPDERKGAELIMQGGEAYPGEQLADAVKILIGEINQAPGYRLLAKEAPAIFGYHGTSFNSQEWAQRIFNESDLVWTLIYLDGLRTSLMMVKASGPVSD